MFASRDKLGRIFTPSPVNRAHPLNRGRVAWWLSIPGMIGGRQFFDLMGLSHGTLTNFTSTSGWRGTTRVGGWGNLLFDGTDDYIETGKIVQLSGDYSLAVSFLTYSTAIQRIFNTRGVASGATPASEGGIAYGLNSGAFFGGNIGGSAVSSSAVSTNVAYRAVVRVSGGICTIYLNGSPASSPTSLGTYTPATQTLTIGNTDGGSPARWWSGLLDDITIYSRALSPAEAQQDYILSQQGYPDVLNRLSSRVYSIPKTFNAAWFRVPRQTMEAA